MALLVALVMIASSALVVTSSLHPAAPSTLSVSVSDPYQARASSAPAITPDAIHPAGVSATVLDTISTLNGTTVPGNAPYAGGQGPQATVAFGDQVATAAVYSGNVVIANATSGVLGSAISVPGYPVALTYDGLNGLLYVADLPFQSVQIVDPATGELVGSLPVPGYPEGITFDPVHDQLIVLTGNGLPFNAIYPGSSSVLFLNPITGTVLSNESTGFDPVGAAVDPSSNEVYVVDEGLGLSPASYGNVSVYSTTTHSLVSRISSAGGPLAVVYDPNNQEMFAANGLNHSVSAFNGSTQALVRTVSVSQNASGLAFDSRNQLVDVVSDEWSQLYQIDANTGAINAGSNNAPVAPSGIAYSALTDRLFLADLDSYVLDGFNATTLAMVTAASLGNDPTEAALDPATGTLYVTDQVNDNLSIINLTTNHLIGNLPTGVFFSDLVFDPADGLLYATNYSGTVDVLNPDNGLVVGSITVGGEPSQILYSASNQRLYVLNLISSNVTVLSGATGALIASISLGNEYVTGGAIDTSTGELYVGGYSFTGQPQSNLTPIDLATDAVGSSVSLPGYTFGVGYDPASGDLAVTLETPVNYRESVAIVDPASGTILESFNSSIFSSAPVWLPGSGLFAWGNYPSNSLSLLEGSPGSVAVSLPVGFDPYSVVTDPTDGLVYVVNSDSSSVSVVSVTAQPNAVLVGTDPASCGPVSLGGSPATGSAVWPTGAYAALAPACFGYTFQGWSVSGGVSILSSVSAATQVTIGGSGTLTAEYALVPGTMFAVGVTVDPSSCGGAVSLGGQEYSSGAPALLAAAPYSVAAGPCDGYTFSGWQLTGGLSFTPQGPLGGTLTVTGNGSLTAVYVAAPAGASSSASTPSLTYTLLLAAGWGLAGALAGVWLVRGRRPPTSPPSAPPPQSAT